MTVNLTFDIADILGVDFDSRRTKVWLETNIDGDVIIDATGNTIRLGHARATINADGTGSFTGLPATNGATNPTAFQYQVHIDYPDRDARNGRGTWASGWFSLTATTDLADVAAVAYVPPTWSSTFTASMEAIRDEAEAARDGAVDVSNIAVDDDVVEALVKGTAGAGPKTRAALSTTITAETTKYAKPLGLAAVSTVTDNLANSTTWVVVAGGEVTFLVPASGRVLISAEFGYSVNATASSLEVALQNDTGTVIAGTVQRVARHTGSTTQSGRVPYSHVLSGLTPGEVRTVRLVLRRGDGTGNVFVSSSDNSTVWGQLIMRATGLPDAPGWKKYNGFVMEANGTTEQNALQEPMVIPDPTGEHELIMFYTGGWASCSVFLAYSNDHGFTWTKVGRVFGMGTAGVSGPIAHTGLTVDGSNLHIQFSSNVADTTLRRVTSTDGGRTFSGDTTIMTKAGWESGRWGNSSCTIVAGTWHMLYEAMETSTSIWKTGYATSPDGLTWTRQNGGNPLATLQHGTGMYGGCDLHRRGDGTWELFYHAGPSGNSPTYIYRAVSADLITWYQQPTAAIVTNTLPYEYDQVADPHVVMIDGKRVMFYEGVNNPTATGKINRAVYE